MMMHCKKIEDAVEFSLDIKKRQPTLNEYFEKGLTL